jgi:hypothetical protein
MRFLGTIAAAIILAQTARPGYPAPAAVGADDVSWQTHNLVFASIAGTADTKGESPRLEISMRPTLRLSGTLDPGKVPKLSAEINPRNYGEHFYLPPVGASVLVVLVQQGEAYSVSSVRLDFMPGDHSPICVVKDFSDPIVSDTLKAVQELRKKDKPAEKTEK